MFRKSLTRWSATLGLVSAALIGTVFGAELPVWALTEEEIQERLQGIPVFTLTDAEGSPLVATIEDDSVAGAFISQEDAKAFLENLKRQDPSIGDQVQVVPVSLHDVYRFNNDSSAQNETVVFAYVPMEEQVEQAQSILREDDPSANVENFRGVPLFIPRSAEQDGYLTIEIEGERYVPFFFEEELLKERVGDIPVDIEVVTLEGIIQAFQSDTPEAEEFLKQVLLVPSRESLQFLQSLSQ
ncbi:MAG: Tic22 family protein [Jaaginema sp. PMC 1079.18]|nr:Tic22 family protein [Jaaginema sp. PMC 1080.18]MEC4851536.1 Tic22 family protein [Jaaginema sp. PMC 1079.18]MEC4865754.1 Tic22 family protein [Jaaginema sp. PMC 1078.18]